MALPFSQHHKRVYAAGSSHAFAAALNIPVQRPRPRRLRAFRAFHKDDEAPALQQDWRTFRASLVEKQRLEQAKSVEHAEAQAITGRASETNMQLLDLHDPHLAAEGCWAHATAGPECGGVLLATPEAPEILKDDSMEQVVILILEHSPQGSVGLVLTRPTGLQLGRERGGPRHPIEGAPTGLQQVFHKAHLHVGGPTAQSVLHVLHPHNLPGAKQVAPGIFAGGEAAAVEEVLSGRLPVSSFKFFRGAVVWGPGQLEREVQAGSWFTAACSRSLVLKRTLQLATPLWRELLLLMGGQHAQVAEDMYEGDEVSGE